MGHGSEIYPSGSETSLGPLGMFEPMALLELIASLNSPNKEYNPTLDVHPPAPHATPAHPPLIHATHDITVTVPALLAS